MLSGELTTAQALARLRREAPAAVWTAAGAVALTAAAIVVALGSDDAEPYELLALLGLGLALATCAALGALVLAGRPGHRLGLALLGGGALGSVWTLATVTVDAADVSQPLGHWAAWLDNWTFIGLLVLVTWPLLLFPDGRLPSRRWRPVARAARPRDRGDRAPRHARSGLPRRDRGERAEPARRPGSWDWVNALGVFGFGIPVGVVAGMVAVHVRARRSPDRAMRAALWASRGLAANFVLCLALTAERTAVYAATLTTSVGAFAATAAVVILRDRAVEVDVLLRRAFIVAGVSVGSLLAFLAIFALATSWPARRRARSRAGSARRCWRSRCGSACATASTARSTATATRRPRCGGSASSSSSPTSRPTRCPASPPRCARRSGRRPCGSTPSRRSGCRGPRPGRSSTSRGSSARSASAGCCSGG